MAQVSLDTASAVSGGADSDDFNSGSVSLTTDQGIAVFIAMEVTDTGKRVNEVFWDPSGVNESMTLIHSNYPSHSKMGGQIWVLDNPTIKSAPVRMHITDGNTNKHNYYIVPVDNADLTTTDSDNQADGTSTGQNVNLASPGQNADGLAIAMFAILSTGAISWNGSENERYDALQQGFRMSVADEDGTGTTNMNASGTESKENNLLVTHFPEAAVTTVDLAGAGDAAADGDGTLTTLAVLGSSEGNSASDGTGAMSLDLALSGAGDASSDGSGVLTTRTPLSGSGNASSDGSGALTVLVPLSGAGHAASDAQATLTTRTRLSGAGNAASDASAPMSVTRRLPGSGNNASDGSGALRVIVEMSGAGNASSEGSGAVSLSLSLSGAGDAASDGAGDLTALRILGASEGNNASDGTGTLTVGAVINLSGAGDASSDGSAALKVTKRLPGSGDASSDGTGALGRLRGLSGAGDAASDGAGTLTVDEVYVTGWDGVKLGNIGTPDNRVDHAIQVFARRVGTDSGFLKIRLYEGAAMIFEQDTPALTTSDVEYTLNIPDVTAAAITNYNNLYVRFQGRSTAGTDCTVRISRLRMCFPDPVTVGGGIVSLSGSGHAASSGSGPLKVLVKLAGSGNAASDGSTILRVVVPISGSGHASSDGSGVLETVIIPVDAPFGMQMFLYVDGQDAVQTRAGSRISAQGIVRTKVIRDSKVLVRR